MVVVAAVGLAGCGGGHQNSRAETWCKGTARVDRTTVDQVTKALGPPTQEWPAKSNDIYGHPFTYDVLAYGDVRFAFATSTSRDLALRVKVCDRATLNKIQAWAKP